MNPKDVKKVGVNGAGTMGATIVAAVCAKYETVVKEANKQLCEQAMKRVQGLVPALVRRGVLSEVEKEVALSRITYTTEFKPFSECQVVIDAVPDDVDLKIEQLAELNKVCPPETTFTTTSSIMSIAALGAGSGRPENMIGTHFCIPAHLMPLVEVAPSLATSEETTEFWMAWLKEGLGKVPVKCKDRPGMVVNALLFPFMNSCIDAIDAGLATPEEIDQCMKLGLGHSMGPCELLDMSSTDTGMISMAKFYEDTKDPRYAIRPLMQRMHEAGFRGQKVGKGFYLYDEKGKKIGPNPVFLKK